ncbi:MAG: hypothetical protein AMXMBFR47_24970 [Planctomycetota bacterium]
MSSGGYDPKAVESEIYAMWEAGGYFHAEPDPARKPFVITIPPPNVTGALHLGHALNNTLQDILIRRKRMQGFNACWLPGTDHAGIATQAVVEKRLREEQKLSRHEIGREGLVKKIWEWKEEYNTRILNQLRRMGCSCDWQRTRFTLDETCAKAVYETFFRFFKDGLIYRGLRLVNWDTQLQTAVADDEVYHETVRGHLWHIRYPIAREGDKGTRGQGDKEGHNILSPDAKLGIDFLVVATTRPETMLADTAVAVHPDDERYQHLIGKHVMLPLMNRPIPVVADGMLVSKEFGTGCVKVTPGHDPNDFACYQRKIGQPDEIGIIDLLTPDGKINDAGRGSAFDYAGMKKEDARKKVVADLEALGLLEKVEPYETDIGHSDRSKTPIEPLRSEQWFVAIDKAGAPRLAEMAMEAVADGRVKFFPERYAKSYLDWLGQKRDWCISRQLWWGHRIPVWTAILMDEFGGRRESTVEQQAALRETLTLFQQLFEEFGLSDDLTVRALQDSVQTYLAICPRNPNDIRLIDTINRSYGPEAGKLGSPKENALLEDIASRLESPFDQDADVLDTWFSSALWPHSTFGWPSLDAPPYKIELMGDPIDAVRDRALAIVKKMLQKAGARATTVSVRTVGEDVFLDIETSLISDRAAIGLVEDLLLETREDWGKIAESWGMLDDVRWMWDHVYPPATHLMGSDLDYFYPTSVLSTAREIISLWVARMVMTGLYNVGRVPFQHVYIHAVIQDAWGSRMSKSAGNGMDPLDLIDAYGADGMRFTLAQVAGETQDIRIPGSYRCPHCAGEFAQQPADLKKTTIACRACKKEFATRVADDATIEKHGLGLLLSPRFEYGRNFVTKVWQAATGFVLPNLTTAAPKPLSKSDLAIEDRWILSRLSATIEEIDQHLEKYRFNEYINAVYSFFWSDFCDWYVELAKPRLMGRDAGGESVRRDDASANAARQVLAWVLDQSLRLLHPAIPYVTETVWKELNAAAPRRGVATLHACDKPLIVSEWPRAAESPRDLDAEREIGPMQEVIRALREIRTSLNAIRSQAKQPALRTLPAAVVRCDAATAALLERGSAAIHRLGQVDAATFSADAAKPAQSLSKILTGIEVYVPIAGLADLEIERKRLTKERDELAGHLARLEGKLANEGFVAKAKPEVVEAERARLEELKAKQGAIERNLAELGG